MLQTFFTTFQDLLFPKLCVGCKKSGTLLCDQCAPKIQFIYTQICPICHRPAIGGITHAGCKSPWGLDGLVSISYYKGPTRSLIRQLKYHHVTIVQELIGQLLDSYLRHESIHFPPAIIVPIPLHQTSQARRGYNQAEIIASQVATHLQLPILATLLKRTSATTSQTRLSQTERQANVKGAFQLATTENIKGASFILIDDVFTTGATLREAAKVLKRAGAKQVFAITLAQEA